MDFKQSCTILELQCPFTEKHLRTAYYKHALYYHPDKNKSDDAEDNFKRVAEAYEYLSIYLQIEKENSKVNNNDIYDSFLSRLFREIFDKSIEHHATFLGLYTQIKTGCYDLALKTFKKLDYKTAIEIIQYLSSYKDVLGIKDETLTMFQSTIENIETNQIILNPSLDNLFQKDVYCLEQNDKIYYIPLWHEEIMFYDSESNENITVLNQLQLPDHVTIDHNNDIHVHIKYCISTALRDSTIPFTLGEKVFELSTKEITIQSHQIVKIIEKGAPRINTNNLLDAHQIGDIIIHLSLY